MAHDTATRREARAKYLYERLTLPQIALALGVSEPTLRRWKSDARTDGDDWDQARIASTMAGQGLERIVTQVVQDYVIQHQATIDQLKEAVLEPADKAKILAALADSFNKTVSAAGRLTPKISELGVAMDVLDRLAKYVSARRPEAADALLAVLEPFGSELSRIYQ
jgi:transposase-like protein